MADLSITAANVIPASTATRGSGTAGVAVTAGQVLAYDSEAGSYKLCDNNSVTADLRKPVGIALHAAAANQPISFVKRGKVTIGATVAVGVTYFSSGTAGGIRPAADNTTGDYVAVVGIGVSTTQIDVLFHESGAAMA